MHERLQQITSHFVGIGREHAQCTDPSLEINERWVWKRAARVVGRRLRAGDLEGLDVFLAKTFARGGYVEGFECEWKAMNTLPHLGTHSHLWAVGYREDAGREFLGTHEADTGTLFVDIRDTPNAPFQPEWSRRRLRKRFGRRYRHLRALGNINYRKPGEPIIFRDEEAGFSAVERWLLEGWSVVFICACADRAGCHGTLAVRQMQNRLQAEERVSCHLEQ
jgi:hypothetical protein